MKLDHAVVIGGSVAGLLAAGAAAKHVARVTVLERDELRDEAVPRKGVPQGNQIHILLPIGESMIDDVLPGIHGELIAAGCSLYNQAAEVPIFSGFGWRCRVELDFAQMIGYRRPLLELLIRRRLLALENVEIRHADATALIAGASGADVAGVLLKGGEEVSADLVIDAGGRGSRAPKWLEQLGFERPREDEVRVYMGYATQFVEVPEELFDAGARGVGTLPGPKHPVAGILMPADNGVHALSAIGMVKDYPPADRAGMLEFLARVPSPLIAEIARRSEPVSEVHTYRQPGNLRRRWEDLERRPGRFVVVGDAVASFNPVYGQGITMAAFGATRLQAALADPEATIEALPASFQESLRGGIDVAFGMAAGGDAMYAGAELHNFERPSPEEVSLSERFERLAVDDPEVMAALLEAGFYMRPEVLESEAIRRKVAALDGTGPRGGADPSAYPTVVHRLAPAPSARA